MRKSLYAAMRRLVKATEGRLILRHVKDKNPFEAYRLLVARFDGASAETEAVEIEDILNVVCKCVMTQKCSWL